MFNVEELRALSQFREQAQSQLQQLTEQVTQLTATVNELHQAVLVLAKGPRRITHGRSGPEAMEILDHDGKVFATQRVMRDGAGRVVGSQS